MVLMYVLIVFTSKGYAVPTTEFKNLDECLALRTSVISLNLDYNAEPKCQAFWKTP